ncbi:TetR/AcrR family transcriptional regulator [Conexibacter arvalis]|uniref:AcrR family transcriptional regulator n=1 Tax=Conexibacter arvalis TaxID=912552 RepID=A0A840I9N9_9ACTN|nr:TetR family transcriptional regulator [Conexibacter arvalis]MBB4660844.1 AcrR family transcriptional regulator [Conexibacter arvalis]
MRSRPPLRADARRNYRAVIDAAIGVLSERPDATMREIADASGVTRTTVYRHFPTRDALVRALFQQIERESNEAARAALAGSPPLAEGLAAIAATAIAFGTRYRFLAGYEAIASDVRAETMRAAADNPVLRWLLVAQRRGEARRDLPPSWQLRMMHSLAVVAVEEVLAGAVDAKEGERLLARTLHAAFAAPR